MYFKFKPITKLASFLLFCGITVSAHGYLFGQAPSYAKPYSREKEIALLHDKLNNSHQRNIVAVTGITGIGKANFARGYIELHEHEYDFVLWIKLNEPLGEQIQQFAQQLALIFPEQAHFARQVECTGNSPAHLKRLLEKINLKWLVVLEEAKDRAAIGSVIAQAPRSSKTNYIITSEISAGWESVVHLGHLDTLSAIDMLTDLSGTYHEYYSKKICQELKNHPYAIKLAANYIRENPSIDIVKFFDLIKRRKKDMLSGPLREVKASFLLSLDKIKQDSDQAYFLLSLGAFLGQAGIPHALLEMCFKEQYGNDEVAFHEAMRVLFRYDILQKEDSTNQQPLESQKYRFHDIVLASLVDRIDFKTKTTLIDTVIRVIKQDFLTHEKASLNDSTNDILKHLITITEHAIAHSTQNHELFSICIDIIENILITQRDYQWGDEYISSIAPHFETCPFNDLKMKFFTYVGAEENDFKKADLKLKRAIDIYEFSNKDNQLSVLAGPGYSYYVQALTYYAANKAFLGDFDASKAINSKLSALVEKYGYDNGNNNFWSVFVNEVMHKKVDYDILIGKGSFKEARQQMGLIFDIIHKHAESHNEKIDLEKLCIWFFAQKYYSLLLDNTQSKDLEEIINSVTQIIARNEPDNKDESDFNIANLYEVLAIANFQNKNISQAKAHIQEALNILEHCFSHIKDHNELALAHLIMAEILQYEGDFEASIPHLKFAETAYQKRLERMPIDNVSKLYSLLANVAKTQRNEIALAYYREQHERLFGKTHARSVLNNAEGLVAVFRDRHQRNIV